VRNPQGVASKRTLFSRLSVLFTAYVAASGLSGCLVAGYSSGGGWFIWPGSLGLIVIVLLVVFVVRRR
jgi:hypothetical protein